MKAALFCCLAAIASADVLKSPYLNKEWQVIGDAPKDMAVQVMLSLKKDTSAVENHLRLVSNPKSPLFRQWLSMEEEQALVKTASAAPILSFFADHKVAAVQEGDLVISTMTVEQIERVFETTVSMQQSSVHGHKWHRAGAIHAPAEVVDAVATVFGLHDFPLPPYQARNITQQAGNAFPIGPTDIRKRYGVPTGLRGNGNKNIRQAVAEFQGQYMDQSDLTTFFKNLVPDAKDGDDKVYAYRGYKASGFGVEALLDIQYIMGNAPGILTEFWELRNFDFCSDLKKWTQSILNDTNPPLVHSVSYGLQSDVPSFCSSYDDIDKDFMRIATRGITLIFASGDSGSGWDGEAIWPSWPAISPYVTSVGATCFTNASKSEEQATIQFGSGSGFSALGAVPDYQKDAVAAYIAAQGPNLPPSDLWKKYQGTYGRACADVSALGEGYQVYVQGSAAGVGGTSASTPTFASLISLINNELAKKNKKPLGFLNPWLYTVKNAFMDVTVGSDKVSRQGEPVPYGFDCAAGWDPATGLGTPKFETLLADAMQH